MMTVPQKVSDLIENSGNSFHVKVAQWFIQNGWEVTVSPYYMDQSQGKAREIDLVAVKRWPVDNMFGRQTGAYIGVRLFIECKYIPSDLTVVFWLADKDKEKAEQLVCTTTPFRKDNAYTERHHYIVENHDRVAKLFATNKGKAPENDPVYKALNQVLNGMISLRDNQESLKSRKPIELLLEFPVVVCSSLKTVYSTDFDRNSTPKQLDKNFQLEVRYAYLDRQQHPNDEYFLIDFVEHGKLGDFIKEVEQDIESARELIG